MKELVSIIIPIYNAESHLTKCIRSLLNQTYINFELILVNDGSKDESGKLCDDFCKIDERVRVIHKINGGSTSARKVGLVASSGKFIAYCDADDSVKENWLENMLNAIGNSDLLLTGYTEVNGSSHKTIINKLSDGFYSGSELEKIYEKAIYTGDFSIGGAVSPAMWSKLFKRELIIKIQPKIDERIKLGEDAALVWESLIEAKSITVCNSIDDYLYNVSTENGLTTTYDKDFFYRTGLLINYLNTTFDAYNCMVMKRQVPYYAVAMANYGFNCEWANRKKTSMISCLVRLYRDARYSWVTEVFRNVNLNEISVIKKYGIYLCKGNYIGFILSYIVIRLSNKLKKI